MRRRFGVKDLLNYKKARNLAYRSQYNLSMDRMKKIKSSLSTKVITYKDCKKAYDYVDKLFPKAKVKDVTIYCASKSCLDRLGLKGIGGCYDRMSQILVISEDLDFSSSKKKDSTWSTIIAKVEMDEVIVHELLHYVSISKKNSITSMNLEEEFAYGNSIEYLRANGRSDNDIIENNFMPFFMTTVDGRKVARQVLMSNGYDIEDVITKPEKEQKKILKKVDEDLFKETKKIATEKAKLLIRIYSEDVDAYDIDPDDSEENEFSMIDLDF